MMLRRINPTMWAVWLMTVCGVPAATVVALHTTMDAFFAPLLPRIDAGGHIIRLDAAGHIPVHPTALA